MLSAIKRIFSSVGNWASKIESWLALGSLLMSWGLFAWLGQQWEWVGSQGWAAISIFALLGACVLLLALSTTYLAISKLMANKSRAADAPIYSGATYEGAHRDLLQFVLRSLFPAVESQSRLQSSIIDERTADDELAALAKGGVAGSLDEYLKLLSPLGCSPVGFVSFQDMIEAVSGLEDARYASFCGQGARLLRGANYEPSANVREAHREWQDSHNDLVAAYEIIKTDPRFPRPIYRGALPTRWGGRIENVVTPTPARDTNPIARADRQAIEVAVLNTRGELGAVAFESGSSIGYLEIAASDKTYKIVVTLDAPDVGRAVRVWDHDETVHSVSLVRGIAQGQHIDVDALHPAREDIVMSIGDRAVALTKDARMIQLVLVSVRDRSAGDAVDAVRFRYKVHERGAHLLEAL
jgi:hypothetical protein